jgi:alpha-galactosidase
MKADWTLHDDGSFDLATSTVSLRRCYPAMDHEPLRPVRIEIRRGPDASEIDYHLTEGVVSIRLARDADSPVLSCTLRGLSSAPHWMYPLHGARVEGADRFFRHGLGFSGPSGFVPLAAQAKSWSLESYLVSAVVAPDHSSIALGALDHSNFLQKTQIHNRVYRSGFCNRDLEADVALLEAGFSTERLALDGADLALPDLHFRAAPTAWDACESLARGIASASGARTHQPPCYHWCSWYQKGCNLTFDDLKVFLDGADAAGQRGVLQSVQIDDGYCASPGDWLTPRDIWPGGLDAAFAEIASRGYRPGVWVAPFMVGCRSSLYAEHSDWVLRDLAGKPIPKWTNYNAGGIPSHLDEETYILDTSHPDALEYIVGVFRTLRKWGATMYKTDFMDWGLQDSLKVRRHAPGRTSVQYFREVLAGIRDAIGDESYWLACISPYAPFVGFADGVRVANDVGPAWSDGGAGNMVQETFASQYFNGVFWQNDPDVLYLRDYHIKHGEAEILALALWNGILGISVNTSDPLHDARPDRLKLWGFLRPSEQASNAHLPYWHEDRAIKVAVRTYPECDGWGVLALNPGTAKVTEKLDMRSLIGADQAYCFAWGPDGAESLGRKSMLVPELGQRGTALYYVSETDTPPPAGLTVGGYLS